MRLIDADKIELDYSGLAHISPYDFIGTAKYFADQIKSMSTVDIDAVEVVRCKDCRWYCVDEHQCKHQICMLVFDDDFCSYGERKEATE